MPTLYFVSSNENKLRELRGALQDAPVTLKRIALDLPEIQSLDPAEVAAFKARRAYEALLNRGNRGMTLVEDTGLGIDAWNGFPGALIKWVLSTVGEAGLARQLHDWPDRRATATVALCLYDGSTLHTFTGQTTGTITPVPRGTFGFGWDSIFQPDGYTQTYGEMPRTDKMAISMRGQAAAKLNQFLRETLAP